MANDFGEDGKEQNINTGREEIDYIEAGLEALENWERPNVEALFSDAHMVELWNSPREEALCAILDELELVQLIPGIDFDPQSVASYVYIWVNWDHLRKGKHPFLYIGSRRFNGDPKDDPYKGTNINLNRDQDSGHDLEKYILAVFSDDGEEGVFRGHAYMLEDEILKAINVRRYTDFYNISQDGAGFTSESGRAFGISNAKRRWSDPKHRKKHSAAITALRADPNSKYNSPEFREKQRAIMAIVTRQKCIDDPEWLRNKGKSRKKRWAKSGVNGKKMSIEEMIEIAQTSDPLNPPPMYNRKFEAIYHALSKVGLVQEYFALGGESNKITEWFERMSKSYQPWPTNKKLDEMKAEIRMAIEALKS